MRKGRTLGKTYGIKARCYWEHHWEHIGNLKGTCWDQRKNEKKCPSYFSSWDFPQFFSTCIFSFFFFWVSIKKGFTKIKNKCSYYSLKLVYFLTFAFQMHDNICSSPLPKITDDIHSLEKWLMIDCAQICPHVS